MAKKVAGVNASLQFTLSASQRLQLINDSTASRPNEICGMLGGKHGRVLEIFPVRNVSAKPSNSFYMEPTELLRTLLLVERRGWDLLAIYHSHPVGAQAVPSRSDIMNASYPDTLQVIILPGLGYASSSIRVFDIVGQHVEEVNIQILGG